MDLFSGSFGCFNRVGRDGQSDRHNGQETNKKVKIWVLKCSRTGFVHYLEAFKDFVDLLLGFLMLRTGALIKLNRQVSPMMKSVKNGIYGVYDSFKTLEDSVVIVDKDILLDPFEKLRVSEELQSLHSDDFECCNEDCFKYLAGSRQVCKNCSISSHFSCIMCGRYFPENAHTALCYTPWKPWRNHMTAAPVLTRYSVIQSRSQSARKGKKEGYVKKNIPFIITNDLNITPFSTSSVADVLKTCGAGSCEDLECNELSVGTSEVIVMVGAALTSSTPLTDVFGKMCNKQTRVFASACFSQFPPCQDDDRDSSITRHPAFRNRAAKTQKVLRSKTCRLLPFRQRVQEKTSPRKPSDQGVVRSLSLMAKQLQEQISEQISNQMSVQHQLPAETVATESLPNCLCSCPSCRKQKPGQTSEQLPFQERPVAEEREGRPSFSGVCSQTRKKHQPEQEFPSVFSFPQHPATHEATLEPKANSLSVCSSCPMQQKDPETPNKLAFQEQPAAEMEPEDKPSFSGGSSPRQKQQPELISTQFSFQQFPYQPQPASHEATLEPEPNCLRVRSPCPKHQPDKTSQKLPFPEQPAAEKEPQDRPGLSGGCYETRKQQQSEQLLTQCSFQPLPASDEATLGPQPNSSCNYSSCRRQQPDKKCQKLSFQEPQFAEEEPEDQPGCSGEFYRQDFHEHIPSKLSFHRHPASELEPQPKFSSDYSFIETSNSEDPPQQSIFLQQFVQKTSETQPMEQTALVEQKDCKQSASESDEVRCQHGLRTRTPSSQAWNICHSGRVSQSIVNPLFRETSPSDVPLSRSPQPPIPPPPSPRIVDVSSQFQPRLQPRNVTCVPHSVTHAPGIVRRSYPPARGIPRRTSPQRAVHLGKSCAAHGRGVVGHFPSVSGAFEQGSMEGPDRSEVQSTTSDGSNTSGFFK